MAQEHKGFRTQVKLPLPYSVLEQIERDQRKYQVKERSQFLADLLCLLYDMTGLVRQLAPARMRLELPILDPHQARADFIGDILRAGGSPSGAAAGSCRLSPVKVRVPNEVMTRVEEDTARFNISSRTQFLTDLYCHVYGRPDLAEELHSREEQLKLSVLSGRIPDRKLDPDLVA